MMKNKPRVPLKSAAVVDSGGVLSTGPSVLRSTRSPPGIYTGWKKTPESLLAIKKRTENHETEHGLPYYWLKRGESTRAAPEITPLAIIDCLSHSQLRKARVCR